MHSMSISDYREKAKRLEAKWANFREQGALVTKRGSRLVLAGFGGAISAGCQKYMPSIPGTPIKTDFAIGIATGVAGTFGLMKGVEDELVAISSGIIGAVTARELGILIA